MLLANSGPKYPSDSNMYKPKVTESVKNWYGTLNKFFYDLEEKFQIKVFGPNKFSSQLEGSKIFTKQLCKKYKIPTAKFGIFEDSNKAKNFVNNSNFPVVVKADNLASGKGVYICHGKEEAGTAIDEIFNGKFGKAQNILIEEFLKGEEMSFFIISFF